MTLEREPKTSSGSKSEVPWKEKFTTGVGFPGAGFQFSRLDNSVRAGYAFIIFERGAFDLCCSDFTKLAPPFNNSSGSMGGGGNGGGGNSGGGGGGRGGEGGEGGEKGNSDGGGGVKNGGGGNGSGGSNQQNDGATIYIDTSIWLTQGLAAQCKHPYTLVLLPFQLQSTLTISWPPITTSVLSSSGEPWEPWERRQLFLPYHQ